MDIILVSVGNMGNINCITQFKHTFILRKFILFYRAGKEFCNYEIYLKLLNVNGKLLVVGLPKDAPTVDPFELIKNRRCIIGSMIGGTVETQEMLDFCAKHNITADIEMIEMQEINEAYERMEKGDVRYRFVVDMASLKK